MPAFEFKTKPYDHQLKEFELSKDMKSRCLFWEMGTGKSKPVLDQAAYLYHAGKINAVLIVAPNGVSQNWIYDEIPAHLHGNTGYRTCLWESKRRKTKTFQSELVGFLQHPGLKTLSITYDGIMTEDGAKCVRKFLDKHRVFYIADETTDIKTPGAKVTKRVVASGRHAAYTRALNGTPVADSPFNIFSQVNFVDRNFWRTELGFSTFLEFKTFFGMWEEGYRWNAFKKRKEFYPLLTRYRNLDILHEKIKKLGSRLMKDDVLDLPPKIYNKVYYDLSPTQRRLYEELKNEFTTWFDDGSLVTAELAIVRLTRLQQICSGYLPADEEDLRLIDEKQPRVKLYMDTLSTVPRQTITWAKYNIDIDILAEAMRKAGVSFVQYDGRVSDDDKQKAKEDFKAGKAKVFLAKPTAAGRGLTLTAADTVIRYNCSFSLDNRLQSDDRAHRLTQKRPVNYIDIIARSTVDEYILKVLRGKHDVANYVMGDELPTWI